MENWEQPEDAELRFPAPSSCPVVLGCCSLLIFPPHLQRSGSRFQITACTNSTLINASYFNDALCFLSAGTRFQNHERFGGSCARAEGILSRAAGISLLPPACRHTSLTGAALQPSVFLKCKCKSYLEKATGTAEK